MKKYLPFVVIAILVVGAMYVFDDSRETQAIAGEEEIRKITQLETLEREIYLPTYVPFAILEVAFETYYVGPMDYSREESNNRESINRHEVEEKYWSFDFIYSSKEDPGLRIRVATADREVILENEDLPANEEIKLAGGNVGYYIASEYGDQSLIWTINEGIYVVELMGGTGEDVTKEELIQMVESFREYRP